MSTRKTRVALCLAAGLLGCQQLPPLPSAALFPDRAATDAPAANDSGIGDPDFGGAAPALSTVEELEGTIRLLLEDSVPNGTEFIGLFRQLTGQGDNRCPGDDLAFTTPTSSCTSSTSWEYFGYAPYVDSIEDKADGSRHRVEIGQASFVITSPEGDTFSVGGGFVHLQDLDDELGEWSQSLTGTYIWTGDGPDWLQLGTQVGWEFEGARPAGAHRFSFSGPIAVGADWLYVDRINWNESVCEGVPEVSLQVRDVEGRWYRWSSGADCSPCGVVSWDDPAGPPQELGELCVDLSESMARLDDLNDFPEGG